MRTFALLHNLMHHRLQAKMLPGLYSAFTIRVVLFSFLSVFLPIFYYLQFIQFLPRQTDALAAVFLSFSLMSGLHIISGYLAGKTAHAYGMRATFTIAVATLLFYVITLSYFHGLGAILLSVIALGLHFGFWWHTYHLAMLHADIQKHFGRDWGLLEGLAILVSIATPFIAGTIAQTHGFQGLFSGSIFIVLILFIFIYFFKFSYRALPISIPLVQDELKMHTKEFIAFMGAGMEIGVLEYIWPLILFTLFKELVIVGAAASFIALIGFVFALLAGHLTDRLPKEKLQKVGSLCVTIAWTGKLIFQTTFGALFWDSWHRAFGSFFYIPLTVISYVSAIQKNENAYLFIRELGYNSAKTIMLILCAVLVWYGVSLWWLLLFGIVGPLLSFSIRNSALEIKIK